MSSIPSYLAFLSYVWVSLLWPVNQPFRLIQLFLPASFKVLRAISNAPSIVSFPPTNPDAWTKMQPGIPLNLTSSSSRIPRHSSSRLNLKRNHRVEEIIWLLVPFLKNFQSKIQQKNNIFGSTTYIFRRREPLTTVKSQEVDGTAKIYETFDRSLMGCWWHDGGTCLSHRCDLGSIPAPCSYPIKVTLIHMWEECCPVWLYQT